MACVQRLADGSLHCGGVRLSHTENDKGKSHSRLTTDILRRVRAHSDAFSQAIKDARPNVIGIESYQIFDDRNVTGLYTSARRLLSLFGLAGSGQVPAVQSAEELVSVFQAPGDTFARFITCLVDIQKAIKNEGSFMGGRGRGAASKTMLVYGAAMCAGFNANLPVFVHSPTELKVGVCKKKSASKQDVADALNRLIPNLEEKVTASIRAKGKHEHVYDAVGHGLLALRVYEEFTSRHNLG